MRKPRVLVLSNATDATADYLCARMRDADVGYTRVDTDSVAATSSIFAAPDGVRLTTGDAVLHPSDVGVVWYRRPQPITCEGGDRYDAAFARMEWTAALEGFLRHVPASRWMNHPATIAGASAKLEQLSRANGCGLAVPAWCCTTAAEDALRFLDEHEGRVIAKPLYAGHIERETPDQDTVIYTSPVAVEDLRAHGPNLGTPTLFQRHVAGVDVRVTVVDHDIVALRLWRDEGGIDIRRDNMAGVKYAPLDLPTRVKAAMHALVRSYGLRFAAVDMMVARDDWYFLEVNPNGQWAWLDLVGGAEIYVSFLRAFRGTS